MRAHFRLLPSFVVPSSSSSSCLSPPLRPASLPLLSSTTTTTTFHSLPPAPATSSPRRRSLLLYPPVAIPPARLLASRRWIFTGTMVGRPACGSVCVYVRVRVCTRSGGTRIRGSQTSSTSERASECCVRAIDVVRRHQRGDAI